MKNPFKNLLFTALAALATSSISSAQDSDATRLLKERSAEFQEDVIKVAHNVYVAVGFGVSPSSMIVGTDGVIIVDTMIDMDSAARALAAFRKITDKPVKGIIFTHSHGDHISGASAFIGAEPPQVWARDNFGAEARTFSGAFMTIQNVRGARQGGFKLPPEKRINNGVAKAYYPKRGGEVFSGGGSEKVEPTHTFSEPRKQIEIAGVKIDLVAVDGETSDALYVWLPNQKVLFSGDNFYKSWPNAYAIRGTPYRDIRSWAQADDAMAKEGAEVLVPGHTRPIIGKAEVKQALTDYRDAIRFVFDKTIDECADNMPADVTLTVRAFSLL